MTIVVFRALPRWSVRVRSTGDCVGRIGAALSAAHDAPVKRPLAHGNTASHCFMSSLPLRLARRVLTPAKRTSWSA